MSCLIENFRGRSGSIRSPHRRPHRPPHRPHHRRPHHHRHRRRYIPGIGGRIPYYNPYFYSYLPVCETSISPNPDAVFYATGYLPQNCIPGTRDRCYCREGLGNWWNCSLPEAGGQGPGLGACSDIRY